ncbi:nucleotide-binding protein [Lachnospiraceae bacterium KM106-2]|nr:nucleotide-binding protein [Lachnospiraceae bacterium KM106-2]
MSCSGNCNSCSSSCGTEKKPQYEPMNQYSKVKKVIGVVSGKGGVGKSLTTSYLTVLMNRKGYNTAVLDADITGPSIPKSFGIHGKVQGSEMGIIPAVTKKGTKVISVNLLLDSEEMPVLWRAPIVSGTVKQFWSDVLWDNVDYMFVDMPPGTGDVPLTVFQSLPLDGIIIVTSPQELVSMIVAKAVNMAKAMNIPILGLVENYSYITCGNCGEKISVFGESHVDEIAEKYQLKVLGRIPIDPKIAAAVDAGAIEDLEGDWLDDAVNYIEENCKSDEKEDSSQEVKKIAVPLDEKNMINQHFGKTKQFKVYTFEGNTLVAQGTLTAEGEGHEAQVGLLAAQGVTEVLCGGIGQEALNGLCESGIKVQPFLQGDIDVMVASYLDGSLGMAQ